MLDLALHMFQHCVVLDCRIFLCAQKEEKGLPVWLPGSSGACSLLSETGEVWLLAARLWAAVLKLCYMKDALAALAFRGLILPERVAGEWVKVEGASVVHQRYSFLQICVQNFAKCLENKGMLFALLTALEVE